MARLDKGELATFKALARKMYFSAEVIERFVEESSASQVRTVVRLIEAEQEARAANRRRKLLRKAHFPAIKSFEGYDFSQVAFPDGYGPADLESLGFIEQAEDFVFFGQSGRGKSHLATAVGLAAIDANIETRFFTCAELVVALCRADDEHRLERYMKDLCRADLIIIDELGYVPIDIRGARLLFQVISACYEARSLIITTNIEFSKWGVVFGDDKLAAAVIDRLVHHGRLIEFNGTSRRMEEALMLGKGGK